MPTIQVIDLRSLSPETFSIYQELILPNATFLLSDPLIEGSEVIALEARKDSKVVGLIIAQIFSYGTSQLYSLFVKQEYRRQGIGFKMFKALQRHLITVKKAKGLAFNYESSLPDVIAIEKILSKLKWDKPRFYLLKCYYDVILFHPEWFQQQLHRELPKNVELFYLKDLKSTEKNRILFEAEQGVFLPYLSPFYLDKEFVFSNSVALRKEDKVIGWCVTHQMNIETIRYTGLYIDKQYHLLGYGIWLLAQAIQLQKEAKIPKALFEVNKQKVDASWWTFVNRRLAPYADSIERINWAVKVF